MKIEGRKERKAQLRKMREKMALEARENLKEMNSKMDAIYLKTAQEETTMMFAIIKGLRETMALIDGQKAVLPTQVDKVKKGRTDVEDMP